MKRRTFVTSMGALLLVRVAAGQPRAQRVALVTISDLSKQPLASLVQGLRELGYEEGRNIQLLPSAAGGSYGGLSTAAGEAVGRGAEVIVTDSSSATRAAKAATSAIPIVMVVGVDPVEYGFVKTLAHPDGNITGIAHSAQFLSAKRLELLKEVLPSLRRVGVLWNGESASQAASLKLTENAAAKLGLKVLPADVRQPRDLPAAFASLSKAGAQALVTVPSAAMAPHYDEILRLASVHKMPVVSSRPDEPRKGALFSYGSDWQASFRRAAVFVDKILKGAKPADLPVEQPTKLEMVVNLRTARALGIVIPQKVLVRADEVIQ